MKKIFKSTLILFVFCLTLSLSGIFFDYKSFAEETAPAPTGEVTISSTEEFKTYIENYDNSKQNDKIVLGRDLDLSELVYPTGHEKEGQQIALSNTIGTATAPFKGTFDGKGHKILNLKYDFSKDMSVAGATKDNYQYAGIFGVTEGATIKNLMISGRADFAIGGYISAYVGGVVALAKNTTFENLQMSANLTCAGLGEGTVELGYLAGSATAGSMIKNVIVRPTNSLALNFSTGVLNAGGLVGRLSGSTIKFSVIQAKFDIDVLSIFSNETNIGGVAGVVEQSNSKIFNLACDNTFDISNLSPATVNIGEVVGAIKNPAPSSKNISNIKFNNKSSIGRFGSMGSYAYTNSGVFDMILPATGLGDLEKNEYLDQGGSFLPNYFANAEEWNLAEGNWDFKDVWYVDSRAICLQAFLGSGLTWSFDDANDTLMTSVETYLSNPAVDERIADFGSSVEINFAFKNDMQKYYTLTSVTVLNKYNSRVSASIYFDETNGYQILDSDYFSIKSKKFNSDTVDGVVLTIKNVTKTSIGAVSFDSKANSFRMKVTSQLYDGTDLKDGEIPAYVYSGSVNNNATEIDTDLPAYSESKPTYGRTYSISASPRLSTATFGGWYFYDETAAQKLTAVEIKGAPAKSPTIQFKFGEDGFVGDFQLVAKYNYDPYIVSFDLDDGILKIEFNLDGREISVVEDTTPGEEEAISKTKEDLKLDIFVKKGYVFNKDEFIENMTIYRAGSDDVTFITFADKPKTLEDGSVCYNCVLDISKLDNVTDDQFSVIATTSIQTKKDNSWLWWAIGGGCGGLLLIVVVILIIVFARRKNGGSGKIKFNKGNFRNTYF